MGKDAERFRAGCKIGFGIVGCGMIAGIHVSALQEIPEAKAVGAWSRSPDRARRFAAEHRVKAYASYEALLERIAELVQDKKITGIAEVRDESDREGMRIAIDLKKGEISTVIDPRVNASSAGLKFATFPLTCTSRPVTALSNHIRMNVAWIVPAPSA